jgi:hypothetical protein
MKTLLSAAAAPEDGANHGGGSASAKTPSVQDILNQPTSALPTGHYDDGSHYGGIRYPVGVGTKPVNDGGKVKMDLSGKTNSVLVPYIANHITQMTGNPNFLTPLPAAVDFLAMFTSYSDAVAAAIAAETAWKDANALRDQLRHEMVVMMTGRAGYIQEASNGNRQVIVSSGLGVKNPPTPAGVLPPPLGLRVDLNGTVGKMILNWGAVSGNGGYLLQQAIVVNGVVGSWELIEVGPKPTITLNGMTVGVEYAFRVAAIGGIGGKSDWSTVVMRTAA